MPRSRSPKKRGLARVAQRTVGRPHLGDEARRKVVHVRLTEALHEQVVAAADRAGQSTSAWGESAFERAVRASDDEDLITSEERVALLGKGE